VSWPIKLAAVAAGAKFNAEGTVAQPAAGQGLAITVTADIPDLAALSPLAGTALPPLKTITAQFKLADTNGGDGIAISDLTVTLPQADLTGSASVRGGVRPLITANLSAKQIDLDAINGAVSTAPAAAPGKPSAPATRSDHVIPDGKLPFDVLRRIDTDLQLAVDDLRSGGQDYKSVKLHAVSKDGKLTVDPLTLGVPGGQMDLTATVDANPDVPLVSVTARAPSLSLQPLLKALNKPGYASGTLELRADLRGAGDTPKAIVASLDGPIGVAVAKGQVDSQLLGGMMSWLVQKTDLSKLANLAGMSTLNCFAVRIDTRSGIGTLQALRLDTSTFDMSGRGTLNFATEAIDLHLRPMISIVGTQIATPVIVRGSFANPYVEPDPVGAVTSNAEAAAELALGAGTGGLSLIIGAAVDKTLSGDACAAPLALARFSQAPAAGGQSGGGAPAATRPSKKPDNPLDALKKLFQ
jgi:AsmA protein